MVGKDIEAHGRGMHRYLQDGQLAAFHQQSDAMKRTFGTGKRTLAKKCATKAKLPAYGIVGPNLYTTMRAAGAYDPAADALLREYTESLKPKLIEPQQGFDSLTPSLWQAYSTGIRMGFIDLGTFNAASILPSGRRSDHAVYPAFAFDLGIDPDTGWNNLKARAYVQLMAGKSQIEYIILGSKIWTSRGFGNYYSGGHYNHIHVSGKR